MDMNVLAWILGLVSVIMATVLVCDFVLGWRAAKAEKCKEEKKKPAVSKLYTGKDAGVDLMGSPRPTFAATLPPDGKQLHLRVPTKSIADRFKTIGKVIEHFEAKRQTIDDLEQLYIFAAMLLSNNLDGEDMAVSTVRERLTADDVVVFLTAYMEWLTEVIRSKN